MSPNCTQSLQNGKFCNAPAMNGSSFCRHHDPQRPPRPVHEESRESESLVLPPLRDKYSILLALDEVIHALAEGRIKLSFAETLLSGIKLVSRIVNELETEDLLESEIPQPASDTNMPAVPEPQFPAWQPSGRVAARVASSSSDKTPAVFSASHRHSTMPDMDSSTECLIRELVAQSQEFAVNYPARA